MINDWRLTNQQDYLESQTLTLKKHDPMIHDHCEFCLETFGNAGLDTGYCSDDGYYWVCEQCFEDFKDYFGWCKDKPR